MVLDSNQNAPFSLPSQPWMQGLETYLEELLQTADLLLFRYPHLRRKADSSLVCTGLRKVLRCLGSFQCILCNADQKWLLLWVSALQERYELFQQRRIPPTSLLHRFRHQCRRAIKQLEQLQRSPAIPLLPGSIPWDAPDVLVGSLRKPSQLDICLVYGFYHVPACQVPQERLPIRYVAIYQSRSFFGEDCGIRFYGRVKRCIPVRRWEISEIPKDSDEWYYRLEVEQWEQLEPPVAVREVPFTHLFTNLFLLTHCRETPALYLKNQWEYRCYQTLRASVACENAVCLHHPKGKVTLKKGRLRVRQGLRPVARYTVQDFHRTPLTIFHSIMRHLEEP